MRWWAFETVNFLPAPMFINLIRLSIYYIVLNLAVNVFGLCGRPGFPRTKLSYSLIFISSTKLHSFSSGRLTRNLCYATFSYPQSAKVSLVTSPFIKSSKLSAMRMSSSHSTSIHLTVGISPCR